MANQVAMFCFPPQSTETEEIGQKCCRPVNNEFVSWFQGTLVRRDDEKTSVYTIFGSEMALDCCLWSGNGDYQRYNMVITDTEVLTNHYLSNMKLTTHRMEKKPLSRSYEVEEVAQL